MRVSRTAFDGVQVNVGIKRLVPIGLPATHFEISGRPVRSVLQVMAIRLLRRKPSALAGAQHRLSTTNTNSSSTVCQCRWLDHAPESTWHLTHRQRLVKPGAAWRLGDRSIKLYSIHQHGADLSPWLLECAMAAAAARLPTPAQCGHRYCLGFVIVHEADACSTAVVDWWENTNELRHHVFRAYPGENTLTDISASGESSACGSCGFKRSSARRGSATR
jgi:hypothetical protein